MTTTEDTAQDGTEVEYKVIEGSYKLEQQLNDLAGEGWRVVAESWRGVAAGRELVLEREVRNESN